MKKSNIIIIIFILSSTILSAQDSILTVHQIIDKHLGVVGGKTELRKIQTAKCDYFYILNGDSLDIIMHHIFPNKMRTDYIDKASSFSSILNEEKAFMMTEKDTFELPSDFKNSMIGEAQSLFNLLDLEKHGWIISIETDSNYISEEHYVIKCVHEELNLIKWRFINKGSFLIDKMLDNKDSESYYFAYKFFNGFLYPTKILFMVNGSSSVMLLKSLETNIQIDESIFEVGN